MDVEFFLRQRTACIRAFYDGGVALFREIQSAIEDGRPPFHDPPYSEDAEPAFLSEWMDAATAKEVMGQACLWLLSDSLKLYFNTLQQEIGFVFDKGEKSVLRKGFVRAYKVALGGVFGTDWSDCPVKFDVIEQVVQVRNGSQHGTELPTLNLRHSGTTLKGEQRPLFAEDAEWRAWREAGGENPWLTPSVTIGRETLFAAIDEVESLGRWIGGRVVSAETWRRGQAIGDPEPKIFELLSAARSSLDLAREGLQMFEARLPEILDQGAAKGMVINGRRMERNTGGPLSSRGVIGAQAFLFNLVTVEYCVAKLGSLPGLPGAFAATAKQAVRDIRTVVDRPLRNSIAHIEDRNTDRVDEGLITSTIFEPDLLCSSRADGSIDAIAVNGVTWDAVSAALDRIVAVD